MSVTKIISVARSRTGEKFIGYAAHAPCARALYAQATYTVHSRPFLPTLQCQVFAIVFSLEYESEMENISSRHVFFKNGFIKSIRPVFDHF